MTNSYEHQSLLSDQPSRIAVVTDNNEKDFAWEMIFKLCVFHLLHTILGMTAFTLVSTSVLLSIGWFPLGCVGFPAFCLVLYVVQVCVQLDVELSNYLSTPKEPEAVTVKGERLVPRHMNVSLFSLMTIVYFLTIKLALSMISLLLLALAIAFPVEEILAQTSNSTDIIVMLLGTDFNMRANPFSYSFACIFMFLRCLRLMDMTAGLSQTATRYFCSQHFPPSIPQIHNHTSMDSSTATVYGAPSTYQV